MNLMGKLRSYQANIHFWDVFSFADVKIWCFSFAIVFSDDWVDWVALYSISDIDKDSLQEGNNGWLQTSEYI